MGSYPILLRQVWIYKSIQSTFHRKFQGEKIESFLEKPDIKKAKEFIKDKRFSWNSGIFMFKAKTLLNEISKFSPETLKYCENSLKGSTKDLDFQRLNKIDFQKCPNKSFDISVMEKLIRVLLYLLIVDGMILEVGKQYGKTQKKTTMVIIFMGK